MDETKLRRVMSLLMEVAEPDPELLGPAFVELSEIFGAESRIYLADFFLKEFSEHRHCIQKLLQ